MDYNSTAIADQLGLAYQDYNWLMAINGSLVGFIIVFFSVMLILNLARGH